MSACQRSFLSMKGRLLPPKDPRVSKTELVTKSFWHNYMLFTHFFLTQFLLLRLCNGVKVLVLPMKSSSACYHKCQCVLTVTAGVCSGKEVNDQQATAVTTVYRWVPLTQNCWFSQPWVNSSQQRGTTGWRDRGKEVQRCWTITWGLGFWGGGKQEADACVTQWQKSERCVWVCVLTNVGVDCCNYCACV